MTTGKPAITPPRSFDLRSVQSAIQAISERFRLTDAAVQNLQLTVGGSTSAATLANLQQQVISLQQQVTALQSALGVNDTISLPVDEAVEIGMPVVPSSNGRCRLADPTDPTAIHAALGLTTMAAAAGQTVTIQRRGVLSVPGAVLDVGYAVFAGADGELVQHPSYGAVALPMGVAVSSSAVWVSPGEPTLLVQGFDIEHEQYLPASVQLVTDALDLATQFAALPDGLFAKVGDTLAPRRLVEGTQIWIDNADGVDGNPVISYVAAGAVRTLEEASIADSCSAVLGP